MGEQASHKQWGHMRGKLVPSVLCLRKYRSRVRGLLRGIKRRWFEQGARVERGKIMGRGEKKRCLDVSASYSAIS